MIEFKNVYLKYIKDFFTLYNINFKINDNTLLVGDCADGTNSIFRLIAKIDTKYAGEIYVDDKNLKQIKDKELDLAYVCTYPFLFKNKSIFDNLYYPLKIRKVKKDVAKTLISNYCKQFYIENLDRKVKNLSFSEQKIVCLLRALVRKPKYVLIEHLFSDFDQSLIACANKIIEELKSHSIILACEPNDKNLTAFADFSRIYLENGSIKD